MSEDLFEPGHMALGLLQVILEGPLELRRARRFGHLRKRLDQLFFGVIEVADLIEQEILQVLHFHRRRPFRKSETYHKFHERLGSRGTDSRPEGRCPPWDSRSCAFSRPWAVTAAASNWRYSRKTDTGPTPGRHEVSFRSELRHDTNSGLDHLWVGIALPWDGNKGSLPGPFVNRICVKDGGDFAIIAWTFWISFPAPASAATRLANDSGTFVSTVPRPAPPVRRQRVRSTGGAGRPRAASSSVASDRRRPHARRGRRGRVPRDCSGGWGPRARRS